MSATHASPRTPNSPQPRYRQRRYRTRATSHLHSTQGGLFSSSAPTYFTPATPKYLRKLYTLHGGRIVPDLLTAQLIVVNSLDDRLIPSLYIDKVVVYDCAWVEESFVKGYMMDLKGFAILPWEYDGQAGWIPEELISGLGSLDGGPPWTSLTSERLEKTDEAEGGRGPQPGSNRADPGLEDSATGATQQLYPDHHASARWSASADEVGGEHFPSELDLLQAVSPTAQVAPTTNRPSPAYKTINSAAPEQLYPGAHGHRHEANGQQVTAFLTPQSRQTTISQPTGPSSSAHGTLLSNTLPGTQPGTSIQFAATWPQSGPRPSDPPLGHQHSATARATVSPKRKSGPLASTGPQPSKRYKTTTPLCDPPLSLTIGNKVITPTTTPGPYHPLQALQAKHPNVAHTINRASISASLSATASGLMANPYLPSGPQVFVPGKHAGAKEVFHRGLLTRQAGPDENDRPAPRPKKIVRKL